MATMKSKNEAAIAATYGSYEDALARFNTHAQYSIDAHAETLDALHGRGEDNERDREILQTFYNICGQKMRVSLPMDDYDNRRIEAIKAAMAKAKELDD